MEIMIKQQDELSGTHTDGKAWRNFLAMFLGTIGIMLGVKDFMYYGIYTDAFHVILFVVGLLVLIIFLVLDVARKPVLSPEFIEFARLKEDKQFINGRVTKVEFQVDDNKGDMCKIYVTGDDGLNYCTAKWLSLINLLSKDLVKMKNNAGTFEITDPEKIALVDRECCIYTGKKNKYLEVYTGDTLTRAVLTGVFSLC